MAFNNLKRNVAREQKTSEKWSRIKENKFNSNAERLKFENLGEKKTGFFLETKIGLKNVYKKKNKMSPSFDFNLMGLFKGMLDEKGTIPLREAKKGHKIIKRAKLPVTASKGKRTIRGNDYIVFEKAAAIRKEQLPSMIDEITRIINKAAEKRVFFDSELQNFGVNKEGKIVIIDTNYTKKYYFKNKKQIKEDMAKRFINNLKESGADKKIIKQFEKKLSE